MDIKTENFGTITAKAYEVAVGYVKRVASRLRHEFQVLVVYGVGAVFKTGDATHLNKFIPALVLAGLEAKFRKIVVAHNIIPFAYDNKICQFTGKIQAGHRAVMETLIDGIPQWEIVLKAAFEGAKPENNVKAFVPEVKLATFVKGLRGMDIQPSDTSVLKMLRLALAENPKANNAAETTSISADTAKAIKDNAIAHAEQVKVALTNGAAIAA